MGFMLIRAIRAHTLIQLQTFRMSWLWISVLFIGTMSSSTVQSQGLRINCDNITEAQEGENLTIHCTMDYSSIGDCGGIQKYTWNKSTSLICDNQTKQAHFCGLENKHTVYLNLSSVEKAMAGIYIISCHTDCGFAHSTISVSVVTQDKLNNPEDQDSTVVQAALFGTIGIVAVLAFFLCLVTQRGRITKRLQQYQRPTPKSDTASTSLSHEGIV